jgi:hypothetical protein
MSASKELEPGTRAMLLLADGLFRLDVAVSSDTLQTIVRNFSSAELVMESVPYDPAASFVFGEAATYKPGIARVAFSLRDGSDAVRVSATIATLNFAQRGTVRVSAQAIVRQASAEHSRPPRWQQLDGCQVR